MVEATLGGKPRVIPPSLPLKRSSHRVGGSLAGYLFRRHNSLLDADHRTNSPNKFSVITNRILKCLGYGSIGALWIALTGAAHAGLMFSISYAIADLDDVVVGTSVGLLVADTAGDGFMGISDVDGMMTNSLLGYPMSTGSALGDDRVLMRMTGATLGTGVTDSSPSGKFQYGRCSLGWRPELGPGPGLTLLPRRHGKRMGCLRVLSEWSGDRPRRRRQFGLHHADGRRKRGYPHLDAGYHLVWYRGHGPAANVSSGTISSVPEPSSLLTSLLLVGSWWLRAGRRRERRRRYVA